MIVLQIRSKAQPDENCIQEYAAHRLERVQCIHLRKVYPVVYS